MKCSIHNKELKQNREYQRGLEDGVDGFTVMLIYVLADKYGFGNRKLSQVLASVQNIADSINKGYVSLQDLKDVLKEECDIEIKTVRSRN